jgi:tripeptidyl-peptidase-1
MRLALTQQNLHRADEWLLSVSDPMSPEYARYWSAASVAKRFAPSRTTINQVSNWLNHSGIASHTVRMSHGGGDLYFNVTVKDAERLLNTTYHIYGARGSGGLHIGCDEYSIPLLVGEHIDFITPTVNPDHELLNPRNRPSSLRLKRAESGLTSALNNNDRIRLSMKQLEKRTPTGCDQLTTLECVRALYRIPVGNTSHPQNSLGVIQFGWVSYLPEDLDLFFAQFEPSLVGKRPTFQSIDGGTRQTFIKSPMFNGEANLDLVYTIALTSPLNVTNYQIGDLYVGGSLNTFLAAIDETYCGALDPAFDPIYPDSVPAQPPAPAGYNGSDCGTHKPTKVISVSWAFDEASFSATYLQRQCIEYLKLGLQGITVIFASGDNGAAGVRQTCLDPATGQNTNSSKGNFNPSFPSTCPYVTSVGGTQVRPNASVLDAEVALEFILSNGNASRSLSSGGGFSNVFPAPAYQYHHTKAYLNNKATPYSNLSVGPDIHTAGRGYPDVALNAGAHPVPINGEFRKIYGTSAASPVFASIIAKINDVRLSMGKNTVGFVNPVLYSKSHLMNDVYQGQNYGCGQTEFAFQATSGWDPVTGLGTPDFERLVGLFKNLP